MGRWILRAVVLCPKGQELWPCETAGEVSSPSVHTLPWGNCRNDLLLLRAKACEGHKSPWKGSLESFSQTRVFCLKFVLYWSLLLWLLSSPAGLCAAKCQIHRLASVCLSQKCLRTLCFILAHLKIQLNVEFAEGGECWVFWWGGKCGFVLFTPSFWYITC